MGVRKDTIRRLVFIKFVFLEAVEDSKKGQPFSSKAILGFHNSVELFLKLIGDRYDVSSQTFKDYWNSVEQQTEKDLSHKTSMESLDEARGNLKHLDVKPDKSNLERFRKDVEEFFDRNFEKFFPKGFREVSLSSLIEDELVRKNFEKALTLAEESKYEESMEQIAIGFNRLITDFEDRKKGENGENPLIFGPNMRYVGTTAQHHLAGELNHNPNNESLEKVIDAVDQIQDLFRVLSLGIDFSEYVRFRAITPKVIKYREEGQENFDTTWNSISNPKLDSEDIEFAKNFMIRCAIRKNENSYEMEYDPNFKPL